MGIYDGLVSIAYKKAKVLLKEYKKDGFAMHIYFSWRYKKA